MSVNESQSSLNERLNGARNLETPLRDSVRPVPVYQPCPVCGGPRRARRATCSDKCRAAHWRQRRQQRDDELRGLIQAGRQVLDALERRLEDSP